MKKVKWFLPAAASVRILPLLILLWSIQTAEAMVVWTDHATVKIRREMTLTPPKAGQTTAVLKAAKNEFEAFQLIVSADRGDLAGVNVTVSDLLSEKGNRIASSSIMIYKEAFINVTTRSTTEGATGNWPDALIPKKDEYVGEVRNAFPFSVVSARNQPVWIEIYVPQSAAAGVYTGSATVTAANQTTVVIPIHLTVWNFALPSTSSLKSAYSIDFPLIPQGHGLGTDYLNQLDLVKTYAKANLLHRITQDYLPGPHTLPGGWDAFDTKFGPLLNGTESLGGKLPGAKISSYRMSIWNHETDLPFIRSLVQNAEKRGWLNRLFAYTYDEPKPDQPAQWQIIKDRVKALHEADPRLRALVTTSVQGASAFGLTPCGSPRQEPCIDLFTPTIRSMDNKPIGNEVTSVEPPGGKDTIGNQRSKYGPEVWWYQACGSHGCGIMGGGPSDPSGYHTGWPSFMIDLPALFSRVMQWQSFKYNVQGELYYDMVYAYGKRDPWVSQFDFAGNGDGTLYYPGTPAKIGGTKHIPIESIRLKLLREGMEDYEYMHLLAEMGERGYAEGQVAKVITHTYSWSRKPEDLYQARENMALQILSHSGPGESDPLPDPTPSSLPEPDIAPNNTPPTAVITAATSDTDPLVVHFSGTGSHDSGGSIAGYEWAFGDGSLGINSEAEHRYAQPGSYKVTLKVTDVTGDSAQTSLIVSVTGISNMPVALWSADPSSSLLIYTFDGSQSIAAEGALIQFEWDFGDNSTATGATVTHEYKTPGNYEIKLTVTDEKGKKTTAAYKLQAGEPAPVINASSTGGGCGMIQEAGPTDFRQAIPTLLIFFAPFWGRILKKRRRILK